MWRKEKVYFFSYTHPEKEYQLVVCGIQNNFQNLFYQHWAIFWAWGPLKKKVWGHKIPPRSPLQGDQERRLARLVPLQDAYAGLPGVALPIVLLSVSLTHTHQRRQPSLLFFPVLEIWCGCMLLIAVLYSKMSSVWGWMVMLIPYQQSFEELLWTSETAWYWIRSQVYLTRYCLMVIITRVSGYVCPNPFHERTFRDW